MIGTVGGNLSADNSTLATAGDVVLKTGTITIGSAGTSIVERSTGTIQILNANNATSLTVANSFTNFGLLDLQSPGGGAVTTFETTLEVFVEDFIHE